MHPLSTFFFLPPQNVVVVTLVLGVKATTRIFFLTLPAFVHSKSSLPQNDNNTRLKHAPLNDTRAQNANVSEREVRCLRRQTLNSSQYDNTLWASKPGRGEGGWYNKRGKINTSVS